MMKSIFAICFITFAYSIPSLAVETTQAGSAATGAETSSVTKTLQAEAGLNVDKIVEKDTLGVTQPPTVTALTNVKESEIPVQLEPVKKSSSEGGSLFKALAGLGVLGVLAAGGYLLVGKYRRSQVSKNSAPEIKVLRQHYLGQKKSLAIIRVAGESILIGVTDNNISLIKSLSLLDDEVPEETPQNFEKVLQDDEDFAISGIRDFVGERLKGMRKFN